MALASFTIMVLLFYNPLFSVAERVVIAQRLYVVQPPPLASIIGLDQVVIAANLFIYSGALWLVIYGLLLAFQSANQPTDTRYEIPFNILDLRFSGQEVLGGRGMAYADRPGFVLASASLLRKIVVGYLILVGATLVVWNLINILGMLGLLAPLAGLVQQVIPLLTLVFNPGPLAGFTNTLGPALVQQLTPRIAPSPIITVSPALIVLGILALLAEGRWNREVTDRYHQDVHAHLRVAKHR